MIMKYAEKALSISLKAFSFIMVLALLQACQKEGCTNSRAANYDSKADKDDGSCIIYGCTDPGAINYDYSATTNDGTCQYYGDGMFWTDADYGHGYISVYLEGSYIGDITNYYSSSPACFTSGCVTVTKVPGTYSFTADADDGTWWQGSITIYGDNCSKMRLYGKKQMDATYMFPIE